MLDQNNCFTYKLLKPAIFSFTLAFTCASCTTLKQDFNQISSNANNLIVFSKSQMAHQENRRVPSGNQKYIATDAKMSGKYKIEEEDFRKQRAALTGTTKDKTKAEQNLAAAATGTTDQKTEKKKSAKGVIGTLGNKFKSLFKTTKDHDSTTHLTANKKQPTITSKPLTRDAESQPKSSLAPTRKPYPKLENVPAKPDKLRDIDKIKSETKQEIKSIRQEAEGRMPAPSKSVNSNNVVPTPATAPTGETPPAQAPVAIPPAEAKPVQAPAPSNNINSGGQGFTTVNDNNANGASSQIAPAPTSPQNAPVNLPPVVLPPPTNIQPAPGASNNLPDNNQSGAIHPTQVKSTPVSNISKLFSRSKPDTVKNQPEQTTIPSTVNTPQLGSSNNQFIPTSRYHNVDREDLDD